MARKIWSFFTVVLFRHSHQATKRGKPTVYSNVAAMAGPSSVLWVGPLEQDSKLTTR